VSTPFNNMIGDDVHNSNKVPNDPMKTSPGPSVPPLLFPQRMDKAKLDQ